MPRPQWTCLSSTKWGCLRIIKSLRNDGCLDDMYVYMYVYMYVDMYLYDVYDVYDDICVYVLMCV